MFGPSRVFFSVLWPLLTSCGSLLLRIFFPMRPQDLPGYSHALSLFTCRIYRKRFRAAIGLCFVMQTHPRSRPYMRFLFVRPEICPLGDLSTPKIRLSSDSASRRTPLPLARPSRYRAASGLSPYRTCAHRAHMHCHAVATVRWTVAGIHYHMKRPYPKGYGLIYVGITYLPGKSPCKYCRRR